MSLKKLFALLVLSLNSLLANAVVLPSFPSYVYFGDSLSDVGNYVAPSGFFSEPCVTVSAPVTNISGGTNPGRMWNQVTADGFSATAASLSNPSGNDWAVAGAQSYKVFNAADFQDSTTQINQYLSSVGNHANANTLYIIWVGANDVITDIFVDQADPETIIKRGMQNIMTGINHLYYAGARNFLVIGLPDISLTPLVAQSIQNDDFQAFLLGDLYQNPACTGSGNTCAVDVKAACDAWNNELFSNAPDPRNPGHAPLAYLKAIHPDINFWTYNPAPLLQNVVANPSAYGFPNTINYVLNTVTYSNLPNNSVGWCNDPDYPDPPFNTDDPDTYIFFNYIHPTTHTHTILADQFRNDVTKF